MPCTYIVSSRSYISEIKVLRFDHLLRSFFIPLFVSSPSFFLFILLLCIFTQISPRQKHPEGSARVLAQRIRKDLKLREMFRRAPFTPVRTVVFVGDSFPEPGGSGGSGVSGGSSGSASSRNSDPRDHQILHHPDLVAFTNLKV